MNLKYHWWDLEKSQFKGILYDSIGLYFIENSSHESWEIFLSQEPHMAYAYLVYSRFKKLEELIVDLRIIPQMMGVEDLPLHSSVENINRYDWLKSISDLAIFRFASIRDVAYHFVNQVFELDIPDHKLHVKTFKKQIGVLHPKIVDKLRILENSGKELRKIRNQRAHKGFSYELTDDDNFFEYMARIEGKWVPVNFNYDIDSIYRSSLSKLYALVVHEVETILSAVIELSDSLCDDYRKRFKLKSVNSKSGTSYCHPFYSP